MNTNNLFQLTFPDSDWKETTTYTFEGPNDSGVQHNLVLAIMDDFPKNVELKDWAKAQCDVSTHLLPGFEYVEEKENTLPSGVKTYEIVYKYIPADEVILFQKQWYMFIDEKAYIFTSTFSKKTLNTILNDVARIVASLRVGKGEEEGREYRIQNTGDRRKRE
ncbi:MAG: DcrB-related protein [Chitinispirillaceae bacterium]|nr:DcrB-related protein [Chitinispirillaceae bacterium]